MKRIFISLAALLVAIATNAADYPYLSFQTADGNVLSVGVEALEMTFSDGKLLVGNGLESHEFNVSDLSRMFFSEKSETGISDILSSTTERGLQVYSASGVYMGMYDSQRDFLQKASKGVYIVKKNDKTLKITVR